MSLKAFHVFFVSISILLCLGFGIWAVRDFVANGTVVSLAGAIATFTVGVLLVWYGKWFLNKLKHVSYL